MKKYVVGGAIRDQLISRNENIFEVVVLNDVDYVVTGMTWAEMSDLYGETIGVDFPVWLDDNNNEVALARVERSTGNRYTDFNIETKDVTIEEDLGRRDLTINAMAVPDEHYNYMFEEKHVIDPYNGLQDMKDKILRHTTAAFEEDPLRILRLARFYANLAPLGFKVALETFELCRRMIKDGMMSNLPQERIWAETLKALNTRAPHLYFKLLDNLGYCRVAKSDLRNLKFGHVVDRHFEESKWALFSSSDAYDNKFFPTKSFRELARCLQRLNDVSLYPDVVIALLEKYRAYHNNNTFNVALMLMQDKIKQEIIRRVLAQTKSINVPSEYKEGRVYGQYIKNERIKIARELLDQ